MVSLPGLHTLTPIGEGPFLTRVDFSDPANPRVTSKLHVLSSLPLSGLGVQSGTGPAEGGYLMPRGHIAQIPSVSGRNEAWLPMQYSNIHDDTWSPDSSFQAVLRRIDLPTRTLPNTNLTKVILTAVNVHDPTSTAAQIPLVGPGWNAHVAGPGRHRFLGRRRHRLRRQRAQQRHHRGAHQHAGSEAGSGPAPLNEIAPASGRSASPSRRTADVAFVANELSAASRWSTCGAGAGAARRGSVTGVPFGGGPVLRGAEMFHGAMTRGIASPTGKGGVRLLSSPRGGRWPAPGRCRTRMPRADASRHGSATR